MKVCPNCQHGGGRLHLIQPVMTGFPVRVDAEGKITPDPDRLKIYAHTSEGLRWKYLEPPMREVTATEMMVCTYCTWMGLSIDLVDRPPRS